MIIRLSAFAIAVLIGHCAQAVAADPAAAFAGHLYEETCIRYVDHPDLVRAWAKDHKLRRIPTPPELENSREDGPEAIAWSVPDPSGSFTLALNAVNQACQVWAKAANPEDAEAIFKAVIAKTKGPDTNLTVSDDSWINTKRGKAHVLTYTEVTSDHRHTIAIVGLLTMARPGGAGTRQVVMDALADRH